jgi:hypothetical protein
MSRSVPDYDAARAWLKSYIAENRPALVEFLNSDRALAEDHLAKAFPYEGGPLPAQLGGIVSILLLQWAETTTAGFWYLRRVMGRLVRSGEPVPELWRNLHAGILDGTITEPITKGGRGSVNERRDNLAERLAVVLKNKFGLPWENNSLNQRGQSAVSIVHAELSELAPNLSMIKPESLAKRIRDRKKDGDQDPIISLLNRRK